MTLESNIPIAEEVNNLLLATSYFENYLYDISKTATAVSNATASTVSVDSADATDLASAITLANELKGDLNTLVTDLNSAITQLNSLLTNLRDSGKLDG